MIIFGRILAQLFIPESIPEELFYIQRQLFNLTNLIPIFQIEFFKLQEKYRELNQSSFSFYSVFLKTVGNIKKLDWFNSR